MKCCMSWAYSRCKLEQLNRTHSFRVALRSQCSSRCFCWNASSAPTRSCKAYNLQCMNADTRCAGLQEVKVHLV